jgi:hypothetical protein
MKPAPVNPVLASFQADDEGRDCAAEGGRGSDRKHGDPGSLRIVVGARAVDETLLEVLVDADSQESEPARKDESSAARHSQRRMEPARQLPVSLFVRGLGRLTLRLDSGCRLEGGEQGDSEHYLPR